MRRLRGMKVIVLTRGGLDGTLGQGAESGTQRVTHIVRYG
jgi:hypothetical protein